MNWGDLPLLSPSPNIGSPRRYWPMTSMQVQSRDILIRRQTEPRCQGGAFQPAKRREIASPCNITSFTVANKSRPQNIGTVIARRIQAPRLIEFAPDEVRRMYIAKPERTSQLRGAIGIRKAATAKIATIQSKRSAGSAGPRSSNDMLIAQAPQTMTLILKVHHTAATTPSVVSVTMILSLIPLAKPINTNPANS